MLNPFPIQFLALLAYFILRVVVGWLLFWQGFTLCRTALSSRRYPEVPRQPILWSLGLLEMVIGLQFIAGFLTQIAALITFALCFFVLLLANQRLRALLPEYSFWFLLAGASLSLFITGAGVFAIDLPI